MENKGRELKDTLEKMILQERYDLSEVLIVSQELDKYILAHYKSHKEAINQFK